MRLKIFLSTMIVGVLFLFSGNVEAQTGTISGTITDAETGTPVASVAVDVSSQGRYANTASANTNDSGRFTVSVPSGTYTLVITRLGYRDQRQDGVSVQAGSTTQVDIVLTSQALALNPIVVSASRRSEKNTDAPATVAVVSEVEIAERPVVTIADHLRSAPGVDIITTGVQSTTVVARGFNNIFSGAMHALVDNRILALPSLRVNLLHFVPQVNDDIERMEVVLGPGSALYGPNTANGVLHIMTKSPLEYQGSSVTLGGSPIKDVFQGSFRTAHKLGDDFAFKISGQMVKGNEWPFVDPQEQAARAAAWANPSAYIAEQLLRGVSTEAANSSLENVGNRDNRFERKSFDFRADWDVTDDARMSFNYGQTNDWGIELTGLGGGQSDSWTSQYAQVRLNSGRFFAQSYINWSDAGNSYLLRVGTPLVDQSRLIVGQLQHGFDLYEGKFDFTYGLDYFYTNPRTLGTINGMNENSDNIKEVGGYVQGRVELNDKLDFVLAGRLDQHNRLVGRGIISPRAALVWEPEENHTFRFTYNRAYSTPSTLNFFLDISGGPAGALGPLGYRTRAQGPYSGFTFMNQGKLVGMRSPFNPVATGGPGQMLPTSSATLWALGVGVLQAQGAIDAATAGLLGSFAPSNTDITRNLFDAGTGQVNSLGPTSVPNIPQLKESSTTTFEAGYQGLIGDRLLIAADVWYSQHRDFISPLTISSPLLMLDGTSMVTYLVPKLTAALIAGGYPASAAPAAALAQATTIATGGDGVGGVPGLAEIPLGVVSANGIDNSAANLLLTYVNAGDVDLYGADFSLKAFLSDSWTLGASGSWVSDDYFTMQEVTNGTAPIALNAPALKGALSLGYRNVKYGINAEARVRANSSFPAESAGYTGTGCVTGPRGDVLWTEPCVSREALVDFVAGYKVPATQATLQMTISNVFDEPYRSFVGVPEIGRFVMLQVKYDF
tara:strand:- start:5208 stop:8060 length:2853 start_codon:yes stop_codon:yes gene_type:complete